MLSQAGLPGVRASITTAPTAIAATWTSRNTQRARPSRRAGLAGAGNRSASTARTPRAAGGGRPVPDSAWPGARRSDADTAGTYHQPTPTLARTPRVDRPAPLRPPSRLVDAQPRSASVRPPVAAGRVDTIGGLGRWGPESPAHRAVAGEDDVVSAESVSQLQRQRSPGTGVLP